MIQSSCLRLAPRNSVIRARSTAGPGGTNALSALAPNEPSVRHKPWCHVLCRPPPPRRANDLPGVVGTSIQQLLHPSSKPHWSWKESFAQRSCSIPVVYVHHCTVSTPHLRADCHTGRRGSPPPPTAPLPITLDEVDGAFTAVATSIPVLNDPSRIWVQPSRAPLHQIALADRWDFPRFSVSSVSEIWPCWSMPTSSMLLIITLELVLACVSSVIVTASVVH